MKKDTPIFICRSCPNVTTNSKTRLCVMCSLKQDYNKMNPEFRVNRKLKVLAK